LTQFDPVFDLLETFQKETASTSQRYGMGPETCAYGIFVTNSNSMRL
jgi:hypothetical protein